MTCFRNRLPVSTTTRSAPATLAGCCRSLALAGCFVATFSMAASANQAPRRRPAPAEGPKPVAAFTKFPDWVPCAAFHPDNRRLAAGSYGVIKLLDVVESREIAALAEPAGLVKSVAFSPDGKTLVSGSYQTAAVWDVESGRRGRDLKGHRAYVTCVAFSPDGKLLATASEDETVKLWDPATGELRQTLSGWEQPTLGVTFSPDGRRLALCTGDATRPTKKGSARVYDLSGNLVLTIEEHDRIVTAVAFSPDGAALVTASADETIKVWNDGGKELRSLEGHTRPVNGLAFLPGGKWLLSVSGGRNVGGNELKLWDVTTGKEKTTIAAHEAPIQHVAVTSDGKFAATAGYDKVVRVWDALALVSPPPGAEKDQAAKQPPAGTPAAALAAVAEAKPLRVGIIGLDTSHAVAFTKALNDPNAPEELRGCPVVAAYPKGSPDIESSTTRVPGYIKDVQALGVEIVDSIDALLEKVDVVLLETNDGRPHLEQVLPVLKAGKPVFVDKPIAGSLTDAVAIFEAARKHNVPLFSSSSLRYSAAVQALRNGKIGDIQGCDAYSPCSLEATHPDLFWYGIHGVETLFTVMKTGCESVTRVSSPGTDLAVGLWKGGRVGTFRGIRDGSAGYGGTAFGSKGIESIGKYDGYQPLAVEIVKFFRTRKPPVAEEETLEIYAFMEAADESKRQGGVPIKLEAVLSKAREAAQAKLK